MANDNSKHNLFPGDIPVFPAELDVVVDGSAWLQVNFPKCRKVVVFDKDETLISSRKEGRVSHRFMIDDVLCKVKPAYPDAITVLYTVSSEHNLRRDLWTFPKLATLFDLFITGDNFSEDLIARFVTTGKLQGNPRDLEWERIYKPVSRIFHPAKAVLIDDCAGTVWSLAEIGKDGIKAYDLDADSPQTAAKMWQDLAVLLTDSGAKTAQQEKNNV